MAQGASEHKEEKNASQAVQQGSNDTVAAQQSNLTSSHAAKDSDNHIEFSIKLVKPPKEKGPRLAQVGSKSEVDDASAVNETDTAKAKQPA